MTQPTTVPGRVLSNLPSPEATRRITADGRRLSEQILPPINNIPNMNNNATPRSRRNPTPKSPALQASLLLTHFCRSVGRYTYPALLPLTVIATARVQNSSSNVASWTSFPSAVTILTVGQLFYALSRVGFGAHIASYFNPRAVLLIAAVGICMAMSLFPPLSSPPQPTDEYFVAVGVGIAWVFARISEAAMVGAVALHRSYENSESAGVENAGSSNVDRATQSFSDLLTRLTLAVLVACQVDLGNIFRAISAIGAILCVPLVFSREDLHLGTEAEWENHFLDTKPVTTEPPENGRRADDPSHSDQTRPQDLPGSSERSLDGDHRKRATLGKELCVLWRTSDSMYHLLCQSYLETILDPTAVYLPLFIFEETSLSPAAAIASSAICSFFCTAAVISNGVGSHIRSSRSGSTPEFIPEDARNGITPEGVDTKEQHSTSARNEKEKGTAAGRWFPIACQSIGSIALIILGTQLPAIKTDSFSQSSPSSIAFMLCLVGANLYFSKLSQLSHEKQLTRRIMLQRERYHHPDVGSSEARSDAVATATVASYADMMVALSNVPAIALVGWSRLTNGWTATWTYMGYVSLGVTVVQFLYLFIKPTLNRM